MTRALIELRMRDDDRPGELYDLGLEVPVHHGPSDDVPPDHLVPIPDMELERVGGGVVHVGCRLLTPCTVRLSLHHPSWRGAQHRTLLLPDTEAYVGSTRLRARLMGVLP